jgi:uncharacterized protein (DUF1800 family)
MARREHRNWSEAHVRRLFWRAGFGATRAEARKWAKEGKRATLNWLVADRPAELVGPAPTDQGVPLDELNKFNHDRLWWLDRMVRSTHPLEEKMTLFWHDHFATTGETTPLMLRQNQTLRKFSLAPFPRLLHAMTYDPALARFLSLTQSVKEAPNENFARELMELFTLGKGYSEKDVREAARALTGLREQRDSAGQTTGVVFDPKAHDDTAKRIFNHVGAYRPDDVLRLCVRHPAHAPFLVSKLWDFFVGGRPPKHVKADLVRGYKRSHHRIRPLVRSILAHPQLYRDLHRPDMIKWPAVLVAGQLRTMGAGIQDAEWINLMSSMGQTLMSPPSVAGWDWGTRWLSSNAMRARFGVASMLIDDKGAAAVAEPAAAMKPADHLRIARRSVGSPQLTPTTRDTLEQLAAAFDGKPEELQRVLRHLLVSGPDNQLC